MKDGEFSTPRPRLETKTKNSNPQASFRLDSPTDVLNCFLSQIKASPLPKHKHTTFQSARVTPGISQFSPQFGIFSPRQ